MQPSLSLAPIVVGAECEESDDGRGRRHKTKHTHFTSLRSSVHSVPREFMCLVVAGYRILSRYLNYVGRTDSALTLPLIS